MTSVIAEIGNCHFGDFAKAKELIRTARECGADLVKGQALCGDPSSGSMPARFYSEAAFSLEQYIELIEYARDIGVSFFYSIFDTSEKQYLKYLHLHQDFHKFSASQSLLMDSQDFIGADESNVFISLPVSSYMSPKLQSANILIATPYGDDISFDDAVLHQRQYQDRNVGVSDHNPGIRSAFYAAHELGVNYIEKHFTLERDMKFKGQVYRDSSFGLLPRELEALTKGLN